MEISKLTSFLRLTATCTLALFVLLMFLMSYETTASAQTKTKKSPANAVNTVSNAKESKRTALTNSNTAPKVVRMKYDDQPFNHQLESVPIGYEGHDPERVAIQIYISDAYSNKKKGEFETTEEYQRKIDEALNKPICCSFEKELTLKSLFAFKIRGFLSLYIGMAYDADKGIMEMAVLPARYEGDDRYERSLYDENTFTLLQGKVSDKQVPFFTTQTKKRVMVRSIKYPLYKITVVNMKDFRLENFATYDERKKGSYYPGISGKKAIIARVKMSGDEAKALKGNDSYVVSDDKGVRIAPRVDSSLDVLFVGNLTSPYLVRNDSEEKATLIKPTNVEKEFYYMNFSLNQIWFYNAKTGKIYAKVGSRFESSIQTTPSYSRPTNQSLQGPASGVKVVKAQAGDTVSKVAARHGADPVEVAKYNGLLPNSVLGAGREIKLPFTGKNSADSKDIKDQLKKANDLYKTGLDDDALAQIRLILAIEPMNGESYALLGKIHLRRGDIDQAITSFKTAVFWDNRLMDAHIGLGKIYVEKGECQQARTYAASAPEIDPQNADALALQRLSERCSK